MQINVTWDTSVLTASVATEIESAVNYVVNLYDNLFTNPITINIDVGWGKVDGQSLVSGALGESITNPGSFTYSQILTALTNNAEASGDPSQIAAVASLPQTNPTNGDFDIATAEAKALGLIPGTSGAVDGYVGFDSNASIWSFDPNITPSASEYYFVGVAEHEISEVMGRFSDIGTGNYSVMDLFRYSAPQQRDLTEGSRHSNSTAYFSIDGGTTNLGTWNNVAPRGDLGDWSISPAPGGHDAFNAATGPGVIDALSTNDITLMNVLGYDVSCFMPNTLIRTPNGERAVESLNRGDFLLTSDGDAMPVRWLGRSTVSIQFADSFRVLPIRIKAGALAESIPARDLLVSPDHAILLDGILVHAGALVNGTSIVREHNVPPRFSYYHVELESHALIYAENALAETFIANVERPAFDNWHERETLEAADGIAIELPYPRAKSFRQLPLSVRERIAVRGYWLRDNALTPAA